MNPAVIDVQTGDVHGRLRDDEHVAFATGIELALSVAASLGTGGVVKFLDTGATATFVPEADVEITGAGAGAVGTAGTDGPQIVGYGTTCFKGVAVVGEEVSRLHVKIQATAWDHRTLCLVAPQAMCGKHVGPGYNVECITMEHEAFVTVTSVDGRLAKWAFRKHRGLFMMVEPDMVQRVIHGIITMDLSGPRVRGSETSVLAGAMQLDDTRSILDDVQNAFRKEVCAGAHVAVVEDIEDDAPVGEVQPVLPDVVLRALHRKLHLNANALRDVLGVTRSDSEVDGTKIAKAKVPKASGDGCPTCATVNMTAVKGRTDIEKTKDRSVCEVLHFDGSGPYVRQHGATGVTSEPDQKSYILSFKDPKSGLRMAMHITALSGTGAALKKVEEMISTFGKQVRIFAGDPAAWNYSSGTRRGLRHARMVTFPTEKKNANACAEAAVRQWEAGALRLRMGDGTKPIMAEAWMFHAGSEDLSFSNMRPSACDSSSSRIEVVTGRRPVLNTTMVNTCFGDLVVARLAKRTDTAMKAKGFLAVVVGTNMSSTDTRFGMIDVVDCEGRIVKVANWRPFKGRMPLRLALIMYGEVGLIQLRDAGGMDTVTELVREVPVLQELPAHEESEAPALQELPVVLRRSTRVRRPKLRLGAVAVGTDTSGAMRLRELSGEIQLRAEEFAGLSVTVEDIRSQYGESVVDYPDRYTDDVLRIGWDGGAGSSFYNHDAVSLYNVDVGFNGRVGSPEYMDSAYDSDDGVGVAYNAMSEVFESILDSGLEPGVTTRREAMAGPHRERWVSRELDELLRLLDVGAARMVSLRGRRRGQRLLPCGWRHYVKPDGSLKARWYICGFGQRRGDYRTTAAPTAMARTVRTVLAIMAHRRMHLCLVDVKSAFMSSPIDVSGMLTRMPPGYAMVDEEGYEIALEILTGINGLRQGAALFYARLRKLMVAFGMLISESDPCLYWKWIDGELIIIAVHVDDLVTVYSHENIFMTFLTFFQKTFESTVDKKPELMLGCEVTYFEDGLRLTSKRLIKKLGGLLGFDGGARSVITPAREGLVLPRGEFEEVLTAEQEVYFAEMKPKLRAIVGLLSYIAGATHPETLRITREIQKCVHTPSWALCEALKRVGRWLLNNLEVGPEFRSGAHVAGRAAVIGFADAAYLPDVHAGVAAPLGYSWRGHVLFAYGCPIEFVSKDISTIMKSTRDVELVAAALAATPIDETVSILVDMHLVDADGQSGWLVTDSQAMFGALDGEASSFCTRHLRTTFLLLRQYVQQAAVVVRWGKTTDMVADFLTKHVGKIVLKELLGKALGRDAFVPGQPSL